jgi:hypothetical protein
MQTGKAKLSRQLAFAADRERYAALEAHARLLATTYSDPSRTLEAIRHHVRGIDTSCNRSPAGMHSIVLRLQLFPGR